MEEKRMSCIGCFHCALNTPLKENMVCCNQDSEHYNKVFSKEDAKNNDFDCFETKRSYDYKHMNAWDFASKYYM